MMARLVAIDRSFDGGDVSTDDGGALRLLRVLATTGAALMLLVVVSSAYIRIAHAGVPCAEWPACDSRGATASMVGDGVRIARFSHRIAAGAVGVVVLLLVALTVTQRPRLARPRAIALAALAVTVALAVLGAGFAESRHPVPIPAVSLVNLEGGLALLALLWWLRLTALAPQPGQGLLRARIAIIAIVTLLAAIAQITLYALVSAGFAVPVWTYRLGAAMLAAVGAVLVIALLRAGGRARSLGLITGALLVAQLAFHVGALLTTQLAYRAGSGLVGASLLVALAYNLTIALLLCALVSVVSTRAGSSAPTDAAMRGAG
ncbi:MAG: hypothetical protein KGR23_04665 [Betaproteobacteria bacterium]|nr:hypothetical protein [Betaproteobacteria bacterium]